MTKNDQLIYRRNKINLNYVNTTGLQNYWPFDNTTQDVIGGADLYGGQNHQFVADRYGKLNDMFIKL